MKRRCQRLGGILCESPDDHSCAHTMVIPGISLLHGPEHRKISILASAVHPDMLQAPHLWNRPQASDQFWDIRIIAFPQVHVLFLQTLYRAFRGIYLIPFIILSNCASTFAPSCSSGASHSALFLVIPSSSRMNFALSGTLRFRCLAHCLSYRIRSIHHHYYQTNLESHTVSRFLATTPRSSW